MTDYLPHPCIEWEGLFVNGGYGRTRIAPGQDTVLAHRVAYCIEHGLDLSDIEGVVIRHKCDNPSCIQPSHLEPGTHQDNADDKVKRGRSLTGEKHGQSKLTEAQVLDIRERYKPYCRVNGYTALAKEYGVCQNLVCLIVKRKIWRHV